MQGTESALHLDMALVQESLDTIQIMYVEVCGGVVVDTCKTGIKRGSKAYASGIRTILLISDSRVDLTNGVFFGIKILLLMFGGGLAV